MHLPRRLSAAASATSGSVVAPATNGTAKNRTTTSCNGIVPKGLYRYRAVHMCWSSFSSIHSSRSHYHNQDPASMPRPRCTLSGIVLVQFSHVGLTSTRNNKVLLLYTSDSTPGRILVCSVLCVTQQFLGPNGHISIKAVVRHPCIVAVAKPSTVKDQDLRLLLTTSCSVPGVGNLLDGAAWVLMLCERFFVRGIWQP